MPHENPHIRPQDHTSCVSVSLATYRAMRDERDQLERDRDDYKAELVKRDDQLIACLTDRDHWRQRYDDAILDQRNFETGTRSTLNSLSECIERARAELGAKPEEALIEAITALRERAHDLANQVMRKDGELSQAKRNLNHWREEAGKLHSQIDRLKTETLQAYGPGLYQVIVGFGPCPKVRNLTETHTAVENSELDVLKLGIHKAGVYVVNEGVTYYPHKDAVVLTNPPPPMDHGLWVQFYRDGITGDAVAWQPPVDAQEAIREVSRGYGGLGVRIDLAKPGTERTTINVQYPQLQRRIERLEAWAAQFTPGVTTSVIARVGRDCVQVDPINGPGDFKTTYPAMPA